MRLVLLCVGAWQFGQHSNATQKKFNFSLNNFAFLSQNQQLEQSSVDQTRLPPSIQSSNGYDSQSNPPPPLTYQNDFDSEPFILPSTMIPPSVLALSSGESKKRGPSANETAQKRKRLKQLQPSISPQALLEKIVTQGGHAYQRISSDDAEYDAVPSALQLASFGTQLVKAVHTSDTEMLSRLLSCGLSPNPCNQFRDSILDLVCKRANETIFVLLLEMGADLQGMSLKKSTEILLRLLHHHVVDLTNSLLYFVSFIIKWLTVLDVPPFTMPVGLAHSVPPL